MKRMILINLASMMFLLTACTMSQVLDESPPEDPNVILTSPTAPTVTLTLEETANQVINALAEMDLKLVAKIVHPEMGVRFSPYAFVQEDHLVFSSEILPGLVETDAPFLWGFYDGTGDPIELTFEEYSDKFVYSADFANPEETAIDERIGQGNSINNIDEFYPGSSFVEYHFSGFEKQYEGMDWESLRLVFVQEDGVWFLVGIVHDEWTI